MTLRSRNRRLMLGAAVASLILPPAARADASPLRFGTTPVFLDNQIALLGLWQGYLERHLQRSVQFVQRGSYREILDLLLSDRLDVAWQCGYPFVLQESRQLLVAVPVYEGEPLYRSHLIVPSSDEKTRHVSELGGRVFAYSDPLSNSGCLVPRVELIRAGQNPDQFFSRTFFTFGHRKVVEAVRVGLARAGEVDGYIWDTLKLQQPAATEGVRVAWRSVKHGFPPIVARANLDPATVQAVASALVGMPESPDGKHLLARLNIDGFVRSDPSLFASIRELVAVNNKVRS